MRYLVTGGAEFIGSHIPDHLLGNCEEVLVLDKFIFIRICSYNKIIINSLLIRHPKLQ